MWQKKRVIIPIAAVIALFGIGSLTSQGKNSPNSQPASPAVTSQPVPPASEEAPEPTEATPDPEPESEVSTLGNGDHIVGEDIEPGVYRAEVEGGIIELCTVSQTDAKGKVMGVRNANEGSVIFTVMKKKDSVVSFSGCGLIALAKDVVREKPDEVTNGYWLVGAELVPGKYQGVVDQEGIVKLGTITQYNAKGKVMNIRNANSGKVVFTVEKSKDSVVSFSGFSEIKKVG